MVGEAIRGRFLNTNLLHDIVPHLNTEQLLSFKENNSLNKFSTVNIRNSYLPPILNADISKTLEGNNFFFREFASKKAYNYCVIRRRGTSFSKFIYKLG